MQIQIISAYLAHDGKIVAIASNSYYTLNAVVGEDKARELVEKINSVRTIETDHWKEET